MPALYVHRNSARCRSATRSSCHWPARSQLIQASSVRLSGTQASRSAGLTWKRAAVSAAWMAKTSSAAAAVKASTARSPRMPRLGRPTSSTTATRAKPANSGAATLPNAVVLAGCPSGSVRLQIAGRVTGNPCGPG